jgi:hypothetical protein
LTETAGFTSIQQFSGSITGSGELSVGAWYKNVGEEASYTDSLVSTVGFDAWGLLVALFADNPPAETGQVADDLDFEDCEGNVLSGVNGLGMWWGPSFPGSPPTTLPDGSPLQPGTQAYNSAINAPVFWNGSTWVSGGGGGSSLTPVEEVPSGTIDGVNVTFTLSYAPAANTLNLYRNGARQDRLKAAPDFSLAGATITMTYPPVAGSQPDTLLATYSH